MAKIIIANKLDTLLFTNKSEFLDQTQLLRLTLEKVRDTDYTMRPQTPTPPQQTRISITKFVTRTHTNDFEMWIEFSIPKDEGIVIGTHVCSLNLSGDLEFQESYGTHFIPENLKLCQEI